MRPATLGLMLSYILRPPLSLSITTFHLRPVCAPQCNYGKIGKNMKILIRVQWAVSLGRLHPSCSWAALPRTLEQGNLIAPNDHKSHQLSAVRLEGEWLKCVHSFIPLRFSPDAVLLCLLVHFTVPTRTKGFFFSALFLMHSPGKKKTL